MGNRNKGKLLQEEGAAMICFHNPDEENDTLGAGYEQGETALLLITDIGRYWIIPIVAINTGLATSVIVFDANTGTYNVK